MRSCKQEVWERLTRIGIQRDEAWFVVGEFNELMCNEEKLGGPRRQEISFLNFRTMARNCQLKEVSSSGNWFSWAGKRG